MPTPDDTEEKTCGRCYQRIKGDPVVVAGIPFHRECDEEGLRAILRAYEQGKRFGYKMPGISS